MLHDYGISMREPAGWNTRFYRIVEPLRGAAILQAATVPFVESDFNTYQPQTCATMSARDALLIAMVFEPDPVTNGWSKPQVGSMSEFAFTPAHFTNLQGLPGEQVQARAVFKHAGRICELVACFGSSNPDGGLLGKIISSLRSLRVTANMAKEPNGDAVEVRLPG